VVNIVRFAGLSGTLMTAPSIAQTSSPRHRTAEP
jgi:hypothetical protein